MEEKPFTETIVEPADGPGSVKSASVKPDPKPELVRGVLSVLVNDDTPTEILEAILTELENSRENV